MVYASCGGKEDEEWGKRIQEGYQILQARGLPFLWVIIGVKIKEDSEFKDAV